MECRGKRLSKLINLIFTGGNRVKSTDKGQKRKAIHHMWEQYKKDTKEEMHKVLHWVQFSMHAILHC